MQFRIGNNKIQIMAYRNVENETEAIFSIAKDRKRNMVIKVNICN